MFTAGVDGGRGQGVQVRDGSLFLGQLPDLTEHDWLDLLKRLTLYADAKARKLRWRGLAGGTNQSMPSGHGPDSIASEAIVSVLNGERKCGARDRDSLLKVLMGVVDSKISHLAGSADNRTMRAAANGHATDSGAPDAWHPATKPGDGPVAMAADPEAARVFRETIRKALEGEPELLELFECLDAGYSGRKEIAEILAIAESEVTNLRKRLARKLEPLRVVTRKAKHGRAGSVR